MADQVPILRTAGTLNSTPLSAPVRWFFGGIARFLTGYTRLTRVLNRRRPPSKSGSADLPTLRENDARYNRFLGNSRDIFLELDTDGRALYISQNVTGILGYSVDELVGTSIFEHVHPDDVPNAAATLLRIIATGQQAELVARFQTKDGRWRWIEAYGGISRSSRFDIRVIVIARDVTERLFAEENARESKERLLLHVEQTPVAVIGWDRGGKLTEWNPAAQAIFGHTRDEAVGREGASILLPAGAPHRTRATPDRELLKGRHYTQENATKDGRRIICEWHDTALVAASGELIGITSIVQDVTNRVKTQEALRDSEAAIRSLYEVTSASHIGFQEKIRAILSMGSSFLRLQSGVIARIDGDRFEVMAAQFPDGRIQVGDIFPLASMYSSRVVADNETVTFSHAAMEGWAEHPAYKRLGMESYIGTPVRVGDSIYGTISFASAEPRSTPFSETDKDFLRLIAQWLGLAIERSNVEEELRHSALHDALTGLPNQRLLHDRLQMAIANAKRMDAPVAVCFLDLDRFKVVNDTLGHRVGDGLLKAVTQRLAGCLRDSDTLARLGGDEFIVVLPHVQDAESAANVAQRLLESLEQPVLVEGQELFATASIGVSLYPADGADVESLIKNADHAMYRAKDLGRDTYHMYSADTHNSVDRLTLETSMRRAIKNEELMLHYQPQIDITTNEIVGIEALVRWNHPERGVVSPGDFIPLAEETGLIIPIGYWVLEEACRQASSWKSLGFPALRLAVNVSARQFRQKSFVDAVQATLRRFDLDPSSLEIELTESVTMHAGEAELESLMRLKNAGVRLAIDDFGTGFASLSNLKRFPIDAVKIDRSFVRDCLNSTDDAAIVKAVVSMGHALHLQVIAEGVETKEQLAFLQLLGCDGAQGFLIGKPMPAEKFERVVAERWGVFTLPHPTEPAA